jgi:hypothetical protein
MGSRYQKTAVLVITTHGGINVEIEETGVLQPVTTDKPEDMDIVLLQTAVCGVVNMLESDKVNEFTQVIRDTIKESDFNNETTQTEMVNIAETIKTKLMQIDDQPAVVAKEIYSKTPGYIDDDETMDYLHHSNKMYNVYSGKTLIDKEFSRANELTNPNSLDWKVNLLRQLDNREISYEDLMVTLNPNITKLRNSDERKQPSILSMYKIISELQRRGISKVIIIDLTCSVIIQNVSETTTRHFRRKQSKKYQLSIKTRGGRTRKKRRAKLIVNSKRK